MGDAKHTNGPWAWYGPTRGEGLTFTHEAHVGPGEGNDVCGPIAAVSGDDDEQAVANAKLVAAAPDILAVVRAYERWEADLVLDGEAWDCGRAFPRFTAKLWDRFLELQTMRNDAVRKAGEG